MLSPKRVETQKLIAFVKLLSKDNNKIHYIVDQKIEHKSKDNSFKCLNYTETKITNDLPSKLRSYFDPFIKDFVRHGSTKSCIKNENVSLFYCVLKACVPKFAEYTEQQQLEYIKCLRGKLVAYISDNEIFKTNNYDKMKWDKKSIYTTLNNFTVTKLTLKILADYFSVNIFVLNILEDKLYVVSGNDYYDMFRLNIFITLNNNTFESLSYLNDYTLLHNNILVKKVISIHKNILLLFNTDLSSSSDVPLQLEFVIKLSEFNISVINKLNKIKENEYNEITESDGVFIKDIVAKPDDVIGKNDEINDVIQEDKPAIGVVFNISSKMKLDALQDIATKFNIDINKKSANGKSKLKTKTELVDEIKIIMLK